MTSPITRAPRRAVRGGVWVVAGRISGLGLAFFVNAALARLLIPGDFGQFVLILSVVGSCAVVGRFGLDRAMIRLIAENRGIGDVAQARRALQMGWRLAILTSLITAVATIIVLGLIGNSLMQLAGQGWLMPMIGLGVLLLSFLHLAAESLRGFHNIAFASLFDGRPNGPLINLVFLTLFVAVAAVSGLSLTIVLCSYVAAVALVLAAALHYLRKTTRDAWAAEPPMRLGQASDPINYSQLLSLCVPLCAGQLLGFVVANADVWIAGACVSSDELALFAAARHLTSIVAVPVYMANLAIISYIPELHAQGRREELQRLVRTAAIAGSVPSLLILIIVSLWPGTVLELVFGPFYQGGAAALVILSLGQFVVSWTGGCQTCLAMTGHQNAQVLVALATSLALLALGTLAARSWGILGLAVVSSSLIATSNVVQCVMARRFVGVWTHAGMLGLWRKAST
jgi:O-antigen/teichoic acid export membrane protein